MFNDTVRMVNSLREARSREARDCVIVVSAISSLTGSAIFLFTPVSPLLNDSIKQLSRIAST